MFESHQQRNIANNNQRSLNELARAITLAQSRFSLTLACCNYTFLRAKIIHQLRQLCKVGIEEIVLDKSAITLYTTIKEKFGNEQPAALMVLGLESVTSLDDLLISANQVRDEFRKSFFFPLVLWVNDEIQRKLVRLVPDFNSWASTPIRFELTTDELFDFLQQTTERVFTKVLNSGNEQFTPNSLILDSFYDRELQAACKDLKNRGQILEPSLEAGVKFVLGREAYVKDRIDIALDFYQQSLIFWQQSNNLERQGILLFHIGLCYIRNGELERVKERQHWEAARKYLEQCLEAFEQASRFDLVALFINQLGEVLRFLKAWLPLQALTEKSVELHQTYGNQVLLAQDYSFLAETALEKKSGYEEAYKFSQQALQILDRVSENKKKDRGLYFLLLARAEQKLGRVEAAFKSLEEAKQKSNPQDNPRVYIQILEELRWLYFQQGEKSEGQGYDFYLKAFQIKKKQRSIEQQYGFRAFIGADRLQPKKRQKSALIEIESKETIAEEITFSGREKDLNYLLKKISQNSCKLIIIHGPSGVGKSSLLDAGFIPRVKNTRIDNKNILLVKIRVYTDWVKSLAKSLSNALENKEIKISTPLDSLESITKQLQENEQHNILTIIILDQFEEFFFIGNKDKELMFGFIRTCIDTALNTTPVKIIVSIREDYLHYLLEYERLFQDSKIDALRDILSCSNRYYLGNFSSESAKSVIRNIGKCSYFHLDPNLIDELVQDLTDRSGEVRPIELQILGMQLQDNYRIKTPTLYRRYGSKKGLLEKFLKDIIQDCGPQNERTARLVLILLTDRESGTRPLKTKLELTSGLKLMGLKLEADNLDLILEVLVGSGIVFSVLDTLHKRYQLIHDYLVGLINKDRAIQAELLTTEEKKRIEDRLRSELLEERKERKKLEQKIKEQSKLIESSQKKPFIPFLKDLTITFDTLKILGSSNLKSIANQLQAEQAFKEYADKYQSRYGLIKLLGMSQAVSLESVYTPVRFLDGSSIHRFESIETLEKAFREGQQQRFERVNNRNLDGIAAANENQYLMVLGGPGAGKTTFLRRMGLEAFKGQEGQFQHSCIPVLLELKRFTTDNFNLIANITEELNYFGFRASQEFTVKALEQGSLMILLDGLDEVSTLDINRAMESIQDFVDKYNKNRFIISCRTAAYHYHSSFRRFTDVIMTDFNNEQIEQFINNWFQSDLDKQSSTAQRCWETLNHPDNIAMKELAQSPLLLTFLCLVYGQSLRFPSNLSSLYNKTLSILLEEWAAEKRVDRSKIHEVFNTDLEKYLLSEIAYQGFETDRLFFTRQELVKHINYFFADTLNNPKYLDAQAILNAIVIQQGILVERAEGIYSFSHLTLQEYLTAEYIVSSDKIKHLVNNYLIDRRWREVFLLVAGLKNSADQLLKLMEVAARKFITTPKLQRLLAWADRATAGSEGDVLPVGKRAIALALVNGLVNTNRLANALTLALAFANANALALALANSNTLNKFIDCICDLEKLKIFTQVNFTRLTDNLKTLKTKLPSNYSSKEENSKLNQLIVKTWLEALNLNLEIVDLSLEELKLLDNYFYANLLIVKCKEAAVRVSLRTWSEIEGRMLLVPPESE